METSSTPARIEVPCNGCTACCKRERIILVPGEDPAQYITVPALGPATGGEVMHMLAHKANGECVYLGKKGCTIHDRAPIVCKAFDCRRWLKAILDANYTPVGDIDQATLDAAWARIDTL